VFWDQSSEFEVLSSKFSVGDRFENPEKCEVVY